MHIIINNSSMVPIYEQIIDQIKPAIIRGVTAGHCITFSTQFVKGTEDQCPDCEESLRQSGRRGDLPSLFMEKEPTLQPQKKT